MMRIGVSLIVGTSNTGSATPRDRGAQRDVEMQERHDYENDSRCKTGIYLRDKIVEEIERVVL